MRTRVAAVGLSLFVVSVAAFAGCVSSGASDSSGTGADAATSLGPDAATTDAATSDGAATSDAATSDAATSDGAATGDGAATDSGFVCGAAGGTYDGQKACVTVADCTTVARGCHCGSQPVLGIAKSAAVAAEACEAQVAGACPLHCPVMPGHVAEDGVSDRDGGTITVLCDLGKCHTVLQ
jgi:hypothetical protein